MTATLNQQIFRQYDVRGIVGRDLTADVARALGRGYAALIAERGLAGAVAVGRDNRPSGDGLRDGLVEGLRRETHGTGVLVHSVNPGPVATDYLLRTEERSRQPGDPDVPLAPGVPASWVADAVLAVAAASHASTRSVPRVVGLTRLAQLPPVGFVVDVVLGRYATSAVAGTRRMVDRRVRALLGR